VAGRRNHVIIENNPNISKTFIFDKSPLKLTALILKLMKEKYDWLIDPKDHDSTESHLLARITRAKNKVGYHSKGKIYDFIVPSNKQNYGFHIINTFFNALKPLGIEIEGDIPEPDLYPSEESLNYASDFVNQAVSKPLFLINISASGNERKWQKEKWIELINSLNSKNYTIALVFAPPEKETAEIILANCPELALFVSRNMNDLIAIVKSSSIVISPDTSVVHVAAAFDIPLIALYNHHPMIFFKFSPLSTKQLIIRAEEGKEVRDISPERVIRDIQDSGLFPGIIK
jgi:ADP-heptose:LPS heptosyltransferase